MALCSWSILTVVSPYEMRSKHMLVPYKTSRRGRRSLRSLIEDEPKCQEKNCSLGGLVDNNWVLFSFELVAVLVFLRCSSIRGGAREVAQGETEKKRSQWVLFFLEPIPFLLEERCTSNFTSNVVNFMYSKIVALLACFSSAASYKRAISDFIFSFRKISSLRLETLY